MRNREWFVSYNHEAQSTEYMHIPSGIRIRKVRPWADKPRHWAGFDDAGNRVTPFRHLLSFAKTDVTVGHDDGRF